MKLVATENIVINDFLLFEKGKEFEKSESYTLVTDSGNMEIPHHFIVKSIKESEEDHFTMKKIDDDSEVQTWRLQLDVRTTRKKAIKIEKFIRDALSDMI